MRAALTVALSLCACGDKDAPDSPEDTERAPDRDGDRDGDGVPESEDCDDGDPLVWRESDWREGSMSSGFAELCAGYCARKLSGTLDLSEATPEEVATLGCLTNIAGGLKITGNAALTSLTGLDSLHTVERSAIIDRKSVV